MGLILVISGMLLSLLILGYAILSSPGEFKRDLENLGNSVEKFKVVFYEETIKTVRGLVK